MRTLPLMSLILLIISSCSKIQVYDVHVNDSNHSKDFWVLENDTVKLTYEFWADKGIMAFSIYNKVDRPIYVDWKNSSFIYNSNKLNYWVDEEYSSLLTYYGGYYYRGPILKPGYTAITNLQGASTKSVKPERITFIPPKSYYYRSQFHLLSNEYYKVNHNHTLLKYLEGEKRKKKNSYYEEVFGFEESPLKFRNYIAFSFSETSQDYFFVDHGFYVKSIKEMSKRAFRGKNLNESGDIPIFKYPFKSSKSFYVEIKPE